MNKTQQQVESLTKLPNNLSIFSYTDETIHLYQEIMSQAYAQTLKADKLEDDIVKFFNGLIWAQKKNPLLVYQMFEMKCCQNIVHKYIDVNPIVILKNSILLLGNCQQGGLVAQQLIEHRYPHVLLTSILHPELLNSHKQQITEYIGNFMKCYHKLFKIQWLSKFVFEQGYFQLLEINLKYYNCPDFMARTNALNILLDLLHYPEVRNLISNCQRKNMFYSVIFKRMCQLFRNQLAEYGLRICHISKQDNIDYIFAELQDKIALWYDLSNNFKDIQNLIELSFCNQVLIPLVLGPIQTKQQIPLFTLKYSLFVITKLMPIIKNFKILQIYIRMIFIEQKVFYKSNSLRKALIQQFTVQKLLTKQNDVDDQQQFTQNNKIKGFYKNLFQSKDNHFILIVNLLLLAINEQGQSCSQISINYGFMYGGQFSIKILHIILNQLKQVHQLLTIQSILHTLIKILNEKSLPSDLQLQFRQIFLHLISQLKNGINAKIKSKQNTNDCPQISQNFRQLAECLQYDLGIVNKVQFVDNQNFKKFQKTYKIVFEWEVKKQLQSAMGFYSRIPDSPSEYIRYLFIKFLLLNKAKSVFLDNLKYINLYEAYHEHILTQCSYIQQDLHNPVQIQEPLQTCQIIDGKMVIAAYLINDRNFFVLGVPRSHRILITHGVSFKHVRIQNKTKKCFNLILRKFDFDIQQLVETEKIVMKSQDSISDHLLKRNNFSIAKNIQFGMKCLNQLQKQIDKLEGLSLI